MEEKKNNVESSHYDIRFKSVIPKLGKMYQIRMLSNF